MGAVAAVTGTAGAGSAERDELVRELHHRVKNNLQIIVSLMNVQKRMLPPDRRDEIRFLEEHVQAMAAAYRVVYASGELTEVPIDDLIREVAAGTAEIAGVPVGALHMARCEAHSMLDLDQAIALGLFLAVSLPPFLDRARDSGGEVEISTQWSEGETVTLSLAGNPPGPVQIDGLRQRLIEGHLRQLAAVMAPSHDHTHLTVTLPAHKVL